METVFSMDGWKVYRHKATDQLLIRGPEETDFWFNLVDGTFVSGQVTLSIPSLVVETMTEMTARHRSYEEAPTEEVNVLSPEEIEQRYSLRSPYI